VKDSVVIVVILPLAATVILGIEDALPYVPALTKTFV
jgi:hypothetical protein